MDVRETAAMEPEVADEHTVRVPTVCETAESIQRAQRALAEIERRNAEARAEQERAEQLTRWHADDREAEAHAADSADEVCRGFEPVDERG